jgi:predicted AlkP superfamily pyrophosphatase or phosphodiesterase
MMRTHRVRAILIFVLLAIGSIFSAERIVDLRPTVILISIDGFRADYVDKIDTPNLHSIIDRGTRAKYMIPSFPAKTFPNHYTIATGLYPGHHGIVANTMYDPERDAWFKIEDRSAVADSRWWGGEPIWVTAEKQGVITAPLCWPGSQAKIEGVTPHYGLDWKDVKKPIEPVDKALSLIDLPVQERPRFITVYFNLVDDAGHDFGPLSPEVKKAVKEVDGAIGELLNGLKDRGIEDRIDVVVVSDHGMGSISPKRVVYLDDYLDLPNTLIVDGSPVLALRPKDGNVQALHDRAKRIPHAKAYLSSEMPERWHYAGSPRVAPVIVLAEDGWTLSTKDYLAKHPLKEGNHGFDIDKKDMRAIFLAAGPGFAKAKLKAFANVDVYSLLCYLLNIAPAANDGTLEPFKRVLLERNVFGPKPKQRAPWQKERDAVAQVQ